MNETAEATNDRDKFVDQFHEFVETHYRGGGITAGALGALWKVAKPDLPWTALGFERLSQVLEDMVARHGEWDLLYRHTPRLMLIRRDEQVSAGAPAARSGPSSYNRPLPKRFWNAFITPGRPGTKRYYNRRTGEVVMDTVASPAPTENWVEIPPIPQELQRGWAKEFLQENGVGDDTALTEAIEGPAWFLAFNETLGARSIDLLTKWRSVRGSKIRAQINEWQRNHGVEIVHSDDGISAKTESRQGDGELRRLLLDAVDQLRTHEILSMRVPLFAAVQALRPDLLR